MISLYVYIVAICGDIDVISEHTEISTIMTFFLTELAQLLRLALIVYT